MISSEDTASIILILLLIVSEILPFVHHAQANGILHLVYVVISQFANLNNNNE